MPNPQKKTTGVCGGILAFFSLKGLLGIPSNPSPRPALNGWNANPISPPHLTKLQIHQTRIGSHYSTPFHPPSRPAPYLSNNHVYPSSRTHLFPEWQSSVLTKRSNLYSCIQTLKSLGKGSVPCQGCFNRTIEAPWIRKCFRHSLRPRVLPANSAAP